MEKTVVVCTPEKSIMLLTFVLINGFLQFGTFQI